MNCQTQLLQLLALLDNNQYKFCAPFIIQQIERSSKECKNECVKEQVLDRMKPDVYDRLVSGRFLDKDLYIAQRVLFLPSIRYNIIDLMDRRVKVYYTFQTLLKRIFLHKHER